MLRLLKLTSAVNGLPCFDRKRNSQAVERINTPRIGANLTPEKRGLLIPQNELDRHPKPTRNPFC